MPQETEVDKTNPEMETVPKESPPQAGVEGHKSSERMLTREEMEDLRALAERLNETYQEITARLRGLESANDDSKDASEDESEEIEKTGESEERTEQATEAAAREKTEDTDAESADKIESESEGPDSGAITRSRPEPQFAAPDQRSVSATEVPTTETEEVQQTRRTEQEEEPPSVSAETSATEEVAPGTESTESSEVITHEQVQNLLAQANEQFDKRNMLHMLREYGDALQDFLNKREVVEQLTTEDDTEKMEKAVTIFIDAAEKVDITIDREKAISGESVEETPAEPEAQTAPEELPTEDSSNEEEQSEEQPEEAAPKREVPAVGRGVAAAVGVTEAPTAETNTNEEAPKPSPERATEAPKIPEGHIDVHNLQSVETVGETEGVFENTDVSRKEIMERARQLIDESRESEVQKQAA